MKILGIDYGTKRIGVAIGDMETKIAVPLSVIEMKNAELRMKNTVERIARIVKDEQVSLMVVGLPTRTDGGKSEMGKKVERFIKELHGKVGVHIVTQDERFTTAQVERSMKGMGKARKGIDKDSAAAALILQSWFDGVIK